ncbi:MAG: CRISPR-associated protein Cas4 [Anaerolineaceae bacterium]|nr:CRISPR-associated protein Cas4 [Anaerolineaceae bacterium]
MIFNYLIPAFLLLLIAAALILRGQRAQQREGLPLGRVVYDDSSEHGGEPIKPLYSAELGLTGKPDYIVVQNGKSIPVEVKSRAAPAEPYAGHVYQLAAYCLLVEHTSGQRPPYGLIRYRDRTFQVDYTDELESHLLEMLDQMRKTRAKNGPARSHESPRRCRNCGYRHVCDQSLCD